MQVNIKERKCKNCKYYYLHSDNSGLCKQDPSWTLKYKDNWCEKYEERKKENR